MLRIRQEQMEVLAQPAQADFHRRLITFLRAELPEETAGFADATLLERIVESEHRASTYGIESEAGIAEFVCLTFVAGPSFAEMPEVREYLQVPGMEPEEKLVELVDYLMALEDETNLE